MIQRRHFSYFRLNGTIKKYIFLAFIITVIIALISMTVLNEDDDNFFAQYSLHNAWRVGKPQPDSIKMAVTACGRKIYDQTMVLLKSAVTLSKSNIHFIILTDNLAVDINNAIQQWPQQILNRISYEIIPVSYPGIDNPKLWKGMYRACSTERLFLTEILKDTDAVLYIDADTLFLDSIDNLWQYFKKFNNKQIMGIAPELDHPKHGYFRVTYGGKVPIFGRSGINAGVLVMNLTRMREFNWRSKLEPIYHNYSDVVYADQGIINIIFVQNPEKLYLLPCRWNYCDEFCAYGTKYCPSAVKDGVAIHHHTGYSKYRDKTHHVTYRAFLNYQLGTDMRENLLEPMKKELMELGTGVLGPFTRTDCTKRPDLFYKALERTINEISEN